MGVYYVIASSHLSELAELAVNTGSLFLLFLYGRRESLEFHFSKQVV